MKNYFYLHPRRVFAAQDLSHGKCDYNTIKNFNTIKIVAGIAIYNIFPDIVSE